MGRRRVGGGERREEREFSVAAQGEEQGFCRKAGEKRSPHHGAAQRGGRRVRGRERELPPLLLRVGGRGASVAKQGGGVELLSRRRGGASVVEGRGSCCRAGRGFRRSRGGGSRAWVSAQRHREDGLTHFWRETMPEAVRVPLLRAPLACHSFDSLGAVWVRVVHD